MEKSQQADDTFLSDDGRTWPHSLLLDVRTSVSYPDIHRKPTTKTKRQQWRRQCR